jgi:hypothetical protein
MGAHRVGEQEEQRRLWSVRRQLIVVHNSQSVTTFAKQNTHVTRGIGVGERM